MAQRCDVCGKGPVGRQHGQSRAQADAAALAAQSRLDASTDAGEARPGSSLHPLSQGGQGHEGHLSTSTNGRGQCPLPIGNWWEAATPHLRLPRPYFFFFLAAFFFFAIEDLTSSVLRRADRRHGSPYFFFFLAAFFFAMESFTSLRCRDQ